MIVSSKLISQSLIFWRRIWG